MIMVTYLVEFRLQGKAQHQIKRMIAEISNKFNIRSKYRAVPHISIAGPLKTSRQAQLIGTFARLCKKYSLMKFKFDGYGVFPENRVVYIKVKSDQQFNNFRKELIRSIKTHCTMPDHCKKVIWYPHITLAMKLNPQKYQAIKKYVERKKKLQFLYKVPRLTLLKEGIILKEYDFILKRLFNRQQAKSKGLLKKTGRLMKDKSNLKSSFEPAKISSIDAFKSWFGF